MLSDENHQVQCMALNKILAIQAVQQNEKALIPSDDFEGGNYIDDGEEEPGNIQACLNICPFRRPIVNH